MNIKNTIKRLIPFYLVGMLSVAILSSCQKDTRPLFTEVYTECCDMPIDIKLKYNLSQFVSQYKKSHDGQEPSDDLSDLRNYHGMHGSPLGGGLKVSDLLRKENSFLEGYEPEILFRFSSPTTRNTKDISYTKYDKSLCEDHIIKDAPQMTKENNRLVVSFSAHTMKTHNGVMVKWVGSNKLVYSENEASIVKIEQYGDVSHSYSFVTKGSSGDQVAGRSGGDTQYGEYKLIPNMIPDVEPGEYEISVTGEDCLVPCVLTNSVCKKGIQVEEIKWEKPELLKIEKISR